MHFINLDFLNEKQFSKTENKISNLAYSITVFVGTSKTYFLYFEAFTNYRSSHQRCSIKKGFIKFFCKIHSKTPVSESV